MVTDKEWAKGGDFSPSPAFDAIADVLKEANDVIKEWEENGTEFSDDMLKEILDAGTSLDKAVGIPVDRVKKFKEAWDLIEDEPDLETRDKISLALGYSPFQVMKEVEKRDQN